MKCILVLAVALVAIAAMPSLAAPVLYDLGQGASPTGVSTDGSVVSFNLGGANVWSRSTATSVNLGSSYSSAGVAITGMSGFAGKSVIVAGNSGGNAYYWSGTAAGSGSWTQLPLSDGANAWTASSVAASATNFWIAGSYGSNPTQYGNRYRASSDTTDSIPLPVAPPYHPNAWAQAVSDTGRVGLVGHVGEEATPGTGGARCSYWWDLANGSVVMNTLNGTPEYGHEAIVQGISRDGTKAVGFSNRAGLPNGSGNLCVIWDLTVDPSPCTQIPFFGTNTLGYAQALNGNGTVAYGFEQIAGAGDRTTWIWDATNGTRDFQTYLAGLGLSTTGWRFNSIKSVSADGTVITGSGVIGGVTKGWIVVIPEPGSMAALMTGLVGFICLRRRVK